MPATVVPEETPDQSQIVTEHATNPFSTAWFSSETLTQIPEYAVGWLVAQGYAITGVTYDTTAKPPIPYFAMEKDTLQNWQILNSLLGEWTFAYNSALDNNNLRYDEVIADWTEMIASSQVHFGNQITEQNAHALTYLADLGVYMTEVDGLILDNETKLIADAAVATTALTALDAKLTDLEANVGTTTSTIETLLSDQAGYLSTFLSDFAAKLAELDSNYAAHLAEIQTLLGDADLDLATFTATQSGILVQLSSAYTTHASVLDGLLTTAGAYLATIESDINFVLSDIASDYTDVDAEVNALLAQGEVALNSHAADYAAVLSLLETDHLAHDADAKAYLVDLGATELARINESFAASLANQLQELADRGFYSSAEAADITARNTRDRDEQIQALNDSLMREKLENEHKLYEQQVTMRAGTLTGKDRIHTVKQELWKYQASQITGLYQLLQSMRDRTQAGKQAIYAVKDGNNRLNIEVRSALYSTGQEMRRLLIEEAARLETLSQAIISWKAGQRDQLLQHIQSVVTQHLAGLERQHGAQQSVSGAAVSVRNILLTQLQDAVKGLLAGKERYAALTLQTASALTEQRHRAIVEKMAEYAVQLEGAQKKHTETMALMEYQLNTRNQLLIGIYGFVERRSDVGPGIEELASITTSLGDSGGGWITP